ncbi:hypothetical protein [Streptomyces sp. NPDC048611]
MRLDPDAQATAEGRAALSRLRRVAFGGLLSGALVAARRAGMLP